MHVNVPSDQPLHAADFLPVYRWIKGALLEDIVWRDPSPQENSSCVTSPASSLTGPYFFTACSCGCPYHIAEISSLESSQAQAIEQQVNSNLRLLTPCDATWIDRPQQGEPLEERDPYERHLVRRDRAKLPALDALLD